MRQVPLVDLVEPAVSGFWGDAPGSCEVDVRVIRNGDVQAGGTLRWSEIPLRGYTLRELSKAEVRCGDLVLTTSGNCGHVAYIDRSLSEPLCASNFLRILRPRASIVDSRYLFHLLNSERFRLMLAPFIRGSTLQNLSYTKAAAAVALPLPPLEEQRRIAAILDKADELRAKRRRARSHLADLQGSLFKAMFGRAVDNGSGRVLGDLIEIQIGPFGSLLHQSDYVVGGVPLVNPMHLVDGRIVPRSRETVAPEAVERLGRYVLREGDVVLGRRGDMGRCAVVGPAEAGFICGSGSMILRPHSDNVRPRFLAAALSSLEARDELARRAKGVTMLNLNSDAVASVRLVCPPLDEQIRFERASHEVDLRAKAQVRSEEDLDSLFASLQSRAFRGEL